MIPKLKFIKKLGILNILFSLIPIIFLFPINIVNIICIIYLGLALYYFKKIRLKIKIEILDIIIFIFFLLIIASSLIVSFSSKYFIKENFIYDIIDKIAIIRYFFVYFLIKIIFQNNLIKIDGFFKISVFCIIFVSINILLMHLIGTDVFGNKEISNRFSSIFGERAIAGTYMLNFFFLDLFTFIFLKKIIT